MERKIEKALRAAVGAFYASGDAEAEPLLNEVLQAFKFDAPFMDKVGMLDDIFDRYSKADELREVFFDLLLVNFFTGDLKKLEEDYLESPEWEDIEERTLDRGTELLNMLLYLNECADEQIVPGLSDYLTEFLLVDEDEFQDEHRIYEDVIANQILTESSFGDIAAASRKIAPDQELKELFYPIMGFFYEPEPGDRSLADFIGNSESPAFDHAVYKILQSFNPAT